MALVANSLFEITAPDGTTVGFAASEEEVDTKIAAHLLAAGKAHFLMRCRTGLLPTEQDLIAWYERQRCGYKMVRVG